MVLLREYVRDEHFVEEDLQSGEFNMMIAVSVRYLVVAT